MPGIDLNIVCHPLSLDPSLKPATQRKCKDGKEKIKEVTEEIEKLLKFGSIQEIKYPTWLSNIVTVKKKSGKWCMCIDFTDLNKAFPKDRYP